MVKTYRVHPAIGIARVGNSNEYFLAPESVDDPPQEKYKVSDGVIKRQAVRFRVFEYIDGKPVREVVHQDGDGKEKILWRVHLANRKAAFEGRNKEVTKRSRLIIDAGPETMSGRKLGPLSMFGSFQCRAAQPADVLLAELRTDEEGRLTVLGGKGRSFSPTNSSIGKWIYNDDWCDDTSDGPVRASVYVPGTGWVEAESAWAVVAPPDFAPEIQPMASLFDAIYQTTKDRFKHDYDPLLAAGKVSFKRHVYPLLERAAREYWVLRLCEPRDYLDPEVFEKLKSNDPAFEPERMKTWNKIKGFAEDPGVLEEALKSAQEKGAEAAVWKFPLYEWRKEVMNRWAAGTFESDWEKPLDSPLPLELDKASLSRCYGYYFAPGIETARIVAQQAIWRAPFRIDTSVIAPGDITAGLAVPWQADYAVCGEGWHAVRPSRAFVSATKPKGWSRGAEEVHRMLHHWAELGFVLREQAEGESFLEKERTNW